MLRQTHSPSDQMLGYAANFLVKYSRGLMMLRGLSSKLHQDYAALIAASESQAKLLDWLARAEDPVLKLMAYRHLREGSFYAGIRALQSMEKLGDLVAMEPLALEMLAAYEAPEQQALIYEFYHHAELPVLEPNDSQICFSVRNQAGRFRAQAIYCWGQRQYDKSLVLFDKAIEARTATPWLKIVYYINKIKLQISNNQFPVEDFEQLLTFNTVYFNVNLFHAAGILCAFAQQAEQLNWQTGLCVFDSLCQTIPQAQRDSIYEANTKLAILAFAASAQKVTVTPAYIQAFSQCLQPGVVSYYVIQILDGIEPAINFSHAQSIYGPVFNLYCHQINSGSFYGLLALGYLMKAYASLHLNEEEPSSFLLLRAVDWVGRLEKNYDQVITEIQHQIDEAQRC